MNGGKEREISLFNIEVEQCCYSCYINMYMQAYIDMNSSIRKMGIVRLIFLNAIIQDQE